MVAPSNLRDPMSEHRDLLPVVVETSGAVMPEGFDSWGIKSVHPDLTTAHGFRWALPGGTSISNDGLIHGNEGACPARPGDGLCVATTWRGMASGGIPARTLLLVAYREADVVGRDEPAGKLRIGAEVATVALIDGSRLIREHGSRAKLQDANLRGADLRGADLRGADLRGADLQGADLRGADLQGADLRGANLWGADLRGVNLRGADLRGVNLRGADLQRADLQRANLQRAYLLGANLRDAGLQYADIQYADLRNADIQYADLRNADIQYADLRNADIQYALWTIGVPTPNGWTLTDTGHLTMETTVVDEQLIDDARDAVIFAACLACPPGGADDYVDRAGLRDLVRAVARYRAVRNSYLAGGEEGMKR